NQGIGYYQFVTLVALTACVVWFRKLRRLYAILAETPFATAFCLLFLSAYIVLFAWYDTILKDSRFVLSIFLPFIFAASIFVLKAAKDSIGTFWSGRVLFPQFLAGMMMILT